MWRFISSSSAKSFLRNSSLFCSASQLLESRVLDCSSFMREETSEACCLSLLRVSVELTSLFSWDGKREIDAANWSDELSPKRGENEKKTRERKTNKRRILFRIINYINTSPDQYQSAFLVKYNRKNRIAWLDTENICDSWTYFSGRITDWLYWDNNFTTFKLWSQTSIERCRTNGSWQCRTTCGWASINPRANIHFIRNTICICIRESKNKPGKQKKNEKYFFHTTIVP